MKFKWTEAAYWGVVEFEGEIIARVHMARQRITGAEDADDEMENMEDMWAWEMVDESGIDGRLHHPWDSARPGRGRCEQAIINWLEINNFDVEGMELTWEPYVDAPILRKDPDWEGREHLLTREELQWLREHKKLQREEKAADMEKRAAVQAAADERAREEAIAKAKTGVRRDLVEQ